MKKINILLIIICLVYLTSCLDKKTTIINEVINRNVTYEDNIDIETFDDAIAEASSLAKHSVVAIQTISGILKTEKNGSGVIINKLKSDNNLFTYYVLTNRHVVTRASEEAEKIYIYLGTKDEYYQANILTLSKNKDYAVIVFTTGRDLPVAKLSTKTIECGRFIITIGSPYKMEEYFNTINVGNISSNNRTLVETDMDGKEVTNTYFQHDAQINNGNSGGGVFNIKGELIGINSWKIIADDIDNMSFAISITLIKEEIPTYFMDGE